MKEQLTEDPQGELPKDDLAGTAGVKDRVANFVRTRMGKGDSLFGRTVAGYLLGIGALAGFVTMAIMIFDHLEQLLKMKEIADLPVHLFITYVVAHAVSTVAIVWFLYQVLKVAERMTLPSYYIDQVISKEPSFLRALLGVEDPTANLKGVVGQLESAAKSVGDAAKAAK